MIVLALYVGIAIVILAIGLGIGIFVAGRLTRWLGAYARADKAEQARERLRNNAAVRGVLEVVKGGSLHRLFSGPFASRDQANEALRELKGMGLNPMVVRR